MARKFFFSVLVSIVSVVALLGVARVEGVELRAVSFVPMRQNDPLMNIFQVWMDKVNKRAKGELKIKYLGSRNVIPANEQMDALRRGVVEIAHTPAYHARAVPEVNFLSASTLPPDVERKIGLYAIVNAGHKEKVNTVYLGRVGSYPPNHFFLYSNVRVERLKDLERLKFRGNVTFNSLLKRLKITSIGMRSGEIYTGMERGLIEGYPTTMFIMRHSLDEVTKYRIDHGFWNSNASNYINKDAFESLPKHLQTLLIEVSKEIEQEDAPKIMRRFIKEENRAQQAKGVKFLKFKSPDDKRIIEIANTDLWEKINKALPKKGPKVRRMLDEAMQKRR